MARYAASTSVTPERDRLIDYGSRFSMGMIFSEKPVSTFPDHA